MNFWMIMNLAAWGISIYILAVMLTDFFRVEREIRHNRDRMAEKGLPDPAEVEFVSGGAKERTGQPG